MGGLEVSCKNDNTESRCALNGGGLFSTFTWVSEVPSPVCLPVSSPPSQSIDVVLFRYDGGTYDAPHWCLMSPVIDEKDNLFLGWGDIGKGASCTAQTKTLAVGDCFTDTQGGASDEHMT